MGREKLPNINQVDTAPRPVTPVKASTRHDVPNRDARPESGLIRRLEALSPVVDDRNGVSVRMEIVTTAKDLRARLHYWRALVAASVAPNPWMEPAAVLSYLDLADIEQDAGHILAPKFLVLWRDSGSGDAFRDRLMVGLLAFTPARKGAEGKFGAALGWRPPGGLATPLVHRHHQRAVAAALSHWLRSGDAGARVLTLEGTGPDEVWRAELIASAEVTGVRLETIGDAPECVFHGKWGELFALHDARHRQRQETAPTSEDVEILTPATLDAASVADAVAYEAVWRAKLSPNDSAAEWIADHRYAHFSLAEDEGRLFIGRGLQTSRVRALVFALKSGPDAVIAGVATDPRLTADDQRILIRRILIGMQARISTYAGIIRLRTGPFADDEITRDIFTGRIARDTVTLSVGRFQNMNVWPLFGRKLA